MTAATDARSALDAARAAWEHAGRPGVVHQLTLELPCRREVELHRDDDRPRRRRRRSGR